MCICIRMRAHAHSVCLYVYDTDRPMYLSATYAPRIGIKYVTQENKAVSSVDTTVEIPKTCLDFDDSKFSVRASEN